MTIAYETEDNGSFGTRDVFGPDVRDYVGTISSSTDVDYMSFTGLRGGTVFAATTLPGGTLSNTTLTQYDSTGKFLAYNDDYGGHSLSKLTGVVDSSGFLAFKVDGYGPSIGTYDLHLSLTIDGTEGANTLRGSDYSETVSGHGGNDIIYGAGGGDSIDGGTGNDALWGGSGYAYEYNTQSETLAGGDGNDTLWGGDGKDSLVGGTGQDLLGAGDGNDYLAGGSGDDTLSGDGNWFYRPAGPGDDRLFGEDGNDLITGDGGNDSCDGGTGSDTIFGGAGNGRLLGGESNDSLLGGADSDFLIGGAGSDVLYGWGDDDISRTRGDASDTLWGGDGADTLYGEGSGDALDGGAGNDVIYGGYKPGSDLALMVGQDGNDSMYGGNGNDTLYGGDGTDRLDGGIGADSMVGGAGNDLYRVDNSGDLVSESAGGGTDQVESAITYALGTNVENLTLTGSAMINGTGNAGGNTLIGNGAVNLLNGLSGNDVLIGGLGNDSLAGGTGVDTMRWTATSLRGGDVSAGVRDVVVGGIGDQLDFTAGIEGWLRVQGTSLASASSNHNVIIGAGFGSGTNVRFDSATHALQFDINGDHAFTAGADFQVALAGVHSVTYDTAHDDFLLA